MDRFAAPGPLQRAREVVSGEIAFDLRPAEGTPTGVGRHLLSVVRALAEHRPDLPLRVYVRGEVAGLPGSVRVVRIRSRGVLWHARTWLHLRRHPARVYCSTSLIIPNLPGVTALPVILDVISFLYPQYHTRRTRIAERLLMGRAVRRHLVAAGSETTRQDLERLFGRCRVLVVPPCLPASVATAPATAASPPAGALERYGISHPYALFVGTVEPRKNVVTAVRAIRDLRGRGVGVRLVIVGKRGWVGEEVIAELRAAQAEGAVVWTGYVTDGERDEILGAASCLVLPSVYEGFGLPLLEAMSRGIACVCSTSPAFAEVGGDAVLRADAFDQAAWANAIERLVADAELRSRLTTAGRSAAARYAPGVTAAAFAEALDALAGSS
jgi:glycosyltransferase involved in cell wall biosynthesis